MNYGKKNQMPIIVLVGVETKMFKILDTHIGKAYLLFPVDLIQSLNLIGFPEDVILFMIDTDNPKIERKLIIEKIKTTEEYQNVPIIGLSLKKHYNSMPKDEKWNFDDILLMPCGTEDLLTRIDIWIKTFETINNDNHTAKSYFVKTPK